MTALRCANRSSAVRSFLRLASRPSNTPLEFLIPQFSLQNTTASSRLPLIQCNNLPSSPIRFFSVSATRRATLCVLNSQKDEDGNEMMVEITPRAAKRLSQIMTKDKNPNLALRISVESGGCHGFQYLMSLITIPPKDTTEYSTIVNDDDAIFQFESDNDDATETQTLSSPEHAPRIILDEPSLDLLKGSKVDFTQELIGSQFKIIDNPYATSSCGCGTSFDIKM